MKYEIKKAVVGDIEMEYEVFGSGSKVFAIIPGLSITSVLGSAKEIAKAYAQFCDDYTVYLFDRRTNIYKGYDVYQMAEDTVAVMKSIGIEKAYLFGASQGGMICQIIAVNHPEMVEKMVVGSTIASYRGIKAGGAGWKEIAEETRDMKKVIKRFATAVYTNKIQAAAMGTAMAMTYKGSEDDIEKFLIHLNANNNFDIEDRLCEVKCPVLAIGAMKDDVAQYQESEKIARLTGGECYLYENYGHGAYDEAPDYKDRIQNFFEK